MRFALLLYCATVPADTHPAYDCVTISIHGDKQAAINAAHEWCLFDHVCAHHTYPQEIEMGPTFHQRDEFDLRMEVTGYAAGALT